MFGVKERLDGMSINKLSIAFSLVILYFLFSFIFNTDFSIKFFSIILILFFVFISIKNKEIQILKPLLIFSSIGFLCVSLNYYIFDRLSLIPVGGPFSTYRRMVELYVLLIPLAFLPAIIDYTGYKAKYLFNVIFIAIAFLGLYTFYYNVKLNFNRGDLTVFFNPILSYDMSFIGLSILSLFYGFYNKSKYSYIIIVLSLFSLFNLISHGSRGAWLALPFIFLLLIYNYFKTQKKKSIMLVVLIAVFFWPISSV